MKCIVAVVLLASLLWCGALGAQEQPSPLPAGGPTQQARPDMPNLSDMSNLINRIDRETPDTLATPIKIVLLITLVSVLPGLLLLTTSFTRIVIVLAFIRSALSTRSIPPSPVVIGLALFLSFFVMAPTLGEINVRAIRPYSSGEIGAQQAMEEGIKPLRAFMFGQVPDKDLELFISMSAIPTPNTQDDVPTYVLIPAFVIGELKKSFELGFLLFLPFLVVDLIVASVLLSMGMIMLPPVMVSAPLKILLFVLVDGWHLVAQSLIFSFGGT